MLGGTSFAGGRVLRGQPLFCGWSSPSGRTPQSAGADSSPFRGAKGIAGYNIRCRKPMPPLKGRGGPPLGGGEVRPRRPRFPLPQPAPTKNTFLGLFSGYKNTFFARIFRNIYLAFEKDTTNKGDVFSHFVL